MRDIPAVVTGCFERSLAEHQDVFQNLGQLAGAIDDAIALAADSLRAGGKILLCGNGGSAADSQHIAAELVGRFMAERIPLPAMALTTDSSILTAVANDYAYDQVFARQVRACGRPGDCLIGYSTSGNSENILEAFRVAKSLGLATIALIGRDGGRSKGLADVDIIVPSNTTSRIQEAHAFIGHAVCEGIEHALGLVDE
jgi:D-sedoheptulose 7-phosphate isomerase